MMTNACCTSALVVLIFMFQVIETTGATVYVDINNSNPGYPYSSWATAATNIQDAIDATSAGDQILVTNGVYETGNRLTSDGVANRVVITNSVVLRTVNGASVTTIDGGQAVRCVSLANGASLIGFTLTKGKGGDGGGVRCASANELVLDCQLINNSGVSGGGAYSGTLSNCTLSGNSSGAGVNNRGGGAFGSILNNCTLTGNRTGNNIGTDGGGAFGCILNDCSISYNSANSDWSNGAGICNSTANNCTLFANSGTYVFGGGAAYSSLTNCIMMGNIAVNGGGGYNCTFVNCTLSSNTATWGGGSYRGTLLNCLLVGNRAYQVGGGAYQGSLFGCTVAGNRAYSGGGVASYNVVNSIVYYNTSTYNEPNYSGSTTLDYCCTTPLPAGGIGNLTNPPGFVHMVGSNFRLQTNSPCINSGKNTYPAVSVDLDGNPRVAGGTMDIGAFEFQSPSSVLSYAWAGEFGIPVNGMADFSDTDGDGLNNWQEWIAGTIPTNGASALKVLSLINDQSSRKVTWQSVVGRRYFLERSTTLSTEESFLTIRSNIVGQAQQTTFTDTSYIDNASLFYRVGVQ